LNSFKPAILIFAAAATVSLSGCASWRVDKAAQVATGFASHLLCDDVFISGADPETAYQERVRPQHGMGLVSWAFKRHVDAEHHQITMSVGGLVKSRAQYREGLGCIALPDGEFDASITTSPSTAATLASAIAEPPVVTSGNERLNQALSHAIVDLAAAGHHTKAIVVMRDGQILGEQYATGYGVDIPVLGFSMTKSVTSALIGVLVREGRLSLSEPAPIAQWSDPADPRHAITVEQLLRQTSGLDLVQNNSGFDVTSQIMYSVRDKAAASAAAPLAHPPGTYWSYSDTNYMLLSRIVRDAAGGKAPDVLRFAHEELFDPLGMHHVTLDFDATETPVGSSHMLASARDWARFGQLYLDDGVANGRRILPEGWVAQTTTPTLSTGYGAGFWTNRLSGAVPAWGAPWGLPSAPRDAFFARGYMGNFTVVIPSQRLVIVRLSVSSVRGDDIEETDRLVGAILEALKT
jgi:CubicO group peptidase (beta-lactamase class C family)